MQDQIVDGRIFKVKKNQPKFLPAKGIFQSPGGILNCRGCFTIITQYRDESYELVIYVINSKYSENLLSRGTSYKMETVKIVGK